MAVLNPDADGPLVVLLPADVEPQSLVCVRADRLSGSEQGLHEIREIEVALLWDVLDHAGLHDVDAHAHEADDLWLLLESAEALLAAVEVQDPVVDLHGTLRGRD